MANEHPGKREDAAEYAMIKRGFASRGTSFTAWCREKGIAHANARAAILGSWFGPKAKALVERVVSASGADSLR